MNKEKKKNPCDKCPWKNKETCGACKMEMERKNKDWRITTIRRIELETQGEDADTISRIKETEPKYQFDF